MCCRVFIKREGKRPIECSSVKELSRWFPGKPPTDPVYDGMTVDRMASHCLCPVNVPAWAQASGYTVEHDGLDWNATPKGQ